MAKNINDKELFKYRKDLIKMQKKLNVDKSNFIKKIKDGYGDYITNNLDETTKIIKKKSFFVLFFEKVFNFFKNLLPNRSSK